MRELMATEVPEHAHQNIADQTLRRGKGRLYGGHSKFGGVLKS